MTAQQESIELATAAARAAAEKIAHDIVVLDVSDQLAITDCFVLASGDNDRQVNAIAEEIEDALDELGAKPVRREGHREGRWVLLDYNDVVVHVQRDPEREFYGLDRLWRDCPQITIEGITTDIADVVAGHAVSAVETEAAVFEAESVDDLPLAGPEPDANEL